MKYLLFLGCVIPYRIPSYEASGGNGVDFVEPGAALSVAPRRGIGDRRIAGGIRDHGRWELLQGVESGVGTARSFEVLVGTRVRAEGANGSPGADSRTAWRTRSVTTPPWPSALSVICPRPEPVSRTTTCSSGSTMPFSTAFANPA